MKRNLFAAFLSVFAASAAAAEPNTIGTISGNHGIIAQVAPVKQDTATALNPAKTTVADCLSILVGLEEIDALHPVIVNAGKPNEQVINVPYEFAGPTLRRGLSSNLRILRAVKADTEQAAQKEMLIISAGKGEIVDSTKQPGAERDREHTEYMRQTLKFNDRAKELTSAPCPIDGLIRMKASELDIDKNKIRAGATAAADKIIDWDK